MTKRSGISRICEQCSGPFLARAIDIEGGRARFCSRECVYDSQRKTTERSTAVVLPAIVEGDLCVSIRIASRPELPILLDIDTADWFLDYPGGWSFTSQGGKVSYVQSTRGYIRLHSLILPVSPPYVCDHKNGIIHDCRKSNLRCATRRVNGLNRRKMPWAKSQFIGVQWISEESRWGSQIKDANGRRWWLGSQRDETVMALIRDGVASWINGDAVRLNFPDRTVDAQGAARKIIDKIIAAGAVPHHGT